MVRGKPENGKLLLNIIVNVTESESLGIYFSQNKEAK